MRDAVFLFDVDGTLLRAGNRTHNQSLRVAVQQVCGVIPELNTVPLAGRTDSEILADMVSSIGVPLEPGMLPRLFEAAVVDFESRCPADISAELIAGVRSTLEALHQHGAALGLVTGNIESVAWRKMAAAGLRRFFGFGAFGDESARRADLPPLAIERAGHWFDPARSYVVGDTPLDIDCGLACGMKTVAVATGRYSLDELRACKPDFACANLPELLEGLIAARI